MDNNQTTIVSPEQNNTDILELISKIAVGQVGFNNEFISMNKRMNYLEDSLDKRIFVSSGQRLEIRKHVKAAVASIAKRKEWDYKIVSKVLFNAIYSDLNEQYNVPSYNDLPAKYFGEIVEKIDDWRPNQVIKDRVEKKL